MPSLTLILRLARLQRLYLHLWALSEAAAEPRTSSRLHSLAYRAYRRYSCLLGVL